MSNLNTGTSSVGEDRFNKAANQEEALAIKKQLAELEAQKALMNFQSQAAQQYNNRLGILAQLVAKNAASNAANNVNWVGHTAEPAMPQFQPRFQGMFSGMLSDPWHQFMNQKEYENRRDRAIANQMDELYRRNQLDQINAAKGNQLDNLIAVMLSQPNTPIPNFGQLNSIQNTLDTGSLSDGSESTQTPNLREIVKTQIGNIAQSNKDINYAKLSNFLKDDLIKNYSDVIDQEFANRAEDKKAFLKDPLGYLDISLDGLAGYKAQYGSDGIDLDNSARMVNYIKRNGRSPDGAYEKIYNDTLGYLQSHLKQLDKSTSGDFNPSDYSSITGEKYDKSVIEAIGRKYFGYNPANPWTKDQLAASMAVYDIAMGPNRSYNTGLTTFSSDKEAFRDWFGNGLPDENPIIGSTGKSNFNDFFKEYGQDFILDTEDREAWKLAEEKRTNAAETLSLLGYLNKLGIIDDNVYKTAKADFSNIYNSNIWGRSTALELFKKGNGATDKKNFTELTESFSKDNRFNPNLNPTEFSGKVISDIESGLTRDEHIMSDPRYQELFLSDKIEDQEAAKRFLSSTYFYTGKHSNLSAEDLNRKATLVNSTYARIKDMLQDRVKQRAAMPNNDIGNGIKNSIDKNFSDNSQTILKNVSSAQERTSITKDFSNLLKHVEGLPSHAYMDGDPSNGRVAILYGVNMKEALRASGVSPEEANKIANDAVKTKKNFGDLDPKYQKAILNYQNRVFQDKWNMGLSSFGVANSQGKRPSSMLGITNSQEARYFDLMVLQANWRGDGSGMRQYFNKNKTTFQQAMKAKVDEIKKANSGATIPHVRAFLSLYKDFAQHSKSRYVLLGSNGKGGRIGNILKFFASKQKS